MELISRFSELFCLAFQIEQTEASMTEWLSSLVFNRFWHLSVTLNPAHANIFDALRV